MRLIETSRVHARIARRRRAPCWAPPMTAAPVGTTIINFGHKCSVDATRKFERFAAKACPANGCSTCSSSSLSTPTNQSLHQTTLLTLPAYHPRGHRQRCRRGRPRHRLLCHHLHRHQEVATSIRPTAHRARPTSRTRIHRRRGRPRTPAQIRRHFRHFRHFRQHLHHFLTLHRRFFLATLSVPSSRQPSR